MQIEGGGEVAAKRFGSKSFGLWGGGGGGVGATKRLPCILVMTYTYTAVTKKLSGFAVGLFAPLDPVDSCKMKFFGADAPG